MTKIMIAAEMTDGQIENAVSKFRDAMRKHRAEVTLDAAQQVLGIDNLGMVMFAAFRERAEMLSTLIVRKVTVNRDRSQQEAIKATRRNQYTDSEVVDSMPKGEGHKVEIVFFKLDLSARKGFISDDDLEKEFELRGLKSADPISVAAVNEADPFFADKRPHCVHWKDAQNRWCYAIFLYRERSHEVSVYRHDLNDGGWSSFWWFTGIRK